MGLGRSRNGQFTHVAHHSRVRDDGDGKAGYSLPWTDTELRELYSQEYNERPTDKTDAVKRAPRPIDQREEKNMSDIKVERVTVHFGGKGSVGDFQNAERSVTLEAALPDDWTFDQAQQALFDLARCAVARQWREVVRGQVDMGYAVQLASAGEARVRAYLEMRAAFDYFEAIDADMAETWLTETTAEILRVAAQVEASRAEEAAKVLPLDGEPEEDDEEDTWDDAGESGYTGDGFTEEYEDGYPADADPDEVEYEKARATYPDLPPYAAVAEPEELPFAAADENGEPAH